MSPWIRAVGLAAALWAAAGPLAADEPLPSGTLRSTGTPPLGPDPIRGAEHVPGWIDACVASGRRQAGTTAGGDLLYSAGVALERRLAKTGRALAVLGEAEAAYPAAAPFRGLVLLEAARLHLARGDATAARRLLDAAVRTARRPPPVDADVLEAGRYALLVQRLASRVPALEVLLDEATGDLVAAARRQEALAATRDRQGEPAAVRAWQRAARLHARARDTGRALAAVDRALELAREDGDRTNLSFWRLYLRHGLLDAEGAPTLGAHWPGDAFVSDLQATVAGLQGNRRVGRWLLALASRAVTAGRDDVALDLYLLALRDPVLVDRARDDATLWGGLLVAFPVALRLGRLDEAERILEVVAGIADVPRKDLDGYRLTLARARETAARTPRPAPRPAPPPPGRDEVEGRDSPHRGRLHPHGPPEGGEREIPAARTPSDPGARAGPSSRFPWVLGALCAAAGLAVFVRVVQRRGRRRAPLGGHPPRR